MNINLIKRYNLFIKSLVINKSSITPKKRREIIKWLVLLWLISGKVDTDKMIQLLYKVKWKLIKDSINNKETKVSKEKVKINDNIVFDRITIKKKWEYIKLHTPKKVIKEKDIKQIKKVKEKTIKTSIKYKEWDLIKYMETNFINNLFKNIKEIY